MTETTSAPTLALERASELAQKTVSTLNECVVGQRVAAEPLLAAYMAGGHVLVQGVPGLGKTLLARAFASCLGVDFKRVQFTPDLMPSDLIGSNVFDQESGSFRLIQGPVFTQILMADEINRTPPKTQAALLEAMQEQQVTIDGLSYRLPVDFFVIATQNPIEFEGTYPLPEAQLDRFLLRIEMKPPTREAELRLFRDAINGELAGWTPQAALPGPTMTREEARGLRIASRGVHVAEELTDYLWRLAQEVRESPHVELAVSPRAALSLLEVARAWALLEARDFLAPDDLKRLIVPSWEHRVILTPESELEGHSARSVLQAAAETVAVPH